MPTETAGMTSVVTFSKVLSVVIVDLTKTSVSLDQVAFGAAQVDLTVLETVKKKTKKR